MAKDDKTNEEEDDFFGDDDDFGLPELDYDALDDEGDSLDDDFDDLDASSLEDTSSDDDDIDDIFNVDSDSDTTEDLSDTAEGEEDMDADIEAAIDEEVTEEEMAEFYEEESFEDFEASTEDDLEIPDSVLDSDVLDEEEFAKFEKELEESGGLDFAEDDDLTAETDKESKAKFVKIVVIGTIAFILLGGGFLLTYNTFKADSDKAVTENVKSSSSKKKATGGKKTTKASGKKKASGAKAGDTKKTPAKKPASKPKKKTPAKSKPTAIATTPGTVNQLTDKTGSYYIIIGSFLDEDLAMDHSKDLASKGKSPSIIPPFGNAITYRVAISGYGSIDQARQSVEGFKGEFGQDIWILKY